MAPTDTGGGEPSTQVPPTNSTSEASISNYIHYLYDSCIDCVAGTAGGWIGCWAPDSEMRKRIPKRHSDFRDSVPPSLQDVHDIYSKHVRYGRWTLGLFDMWNGKSKLVKHAVHVPCWDSFRLNPCAWRGLWFGKTWNECLFTGFRQMRWARAAYSGALGREYVLPVLDIGTHGYLSDIRALFGLYCAMSCSFSCGIGQIFSLCGNLGCNFGACYSCHSREKMRRRYGLPSAFCMPPGIDDCLVHFFCFYCASHQELRELAVRGVDGPGLHVLDVCPDSYAGAPGIETALQQRKSAVDDMLAHPPRMFRSRVQFESARSALMARLDQGFHSSALNAYGTVKQTVFSFPHPTAGHKNLRCCSDLGWCVPCHQAPSMMTMKRTMSDTITFATELSRRELSIIFPHISGGSLNVDYTPAAAIQGTSSIMSSLSHHVEEDVEENVEENVEEDLELPSKSWSIAF